jgi:rod shape-determining protein MreB
MAKREVRWRPRPQIILDISSDQIRAGLVFEPDCLSVANVLVLDKTGQEVMAIGAKAEALVERLSSSSLKIVRPLHSGRIHNPASLLYLLRGMIDDLVGRYFFILRQPEIYLVLSDNCSDIEKAAYRQILEKLTNKNAYFVSAQPAAAAASSLVLPDDDGVILQLGYDQSQIGILSDGEIKYQKTLDYSKAEMLDLLSLWFRREKGIEVSRHDVDLLFNKALQVLNPASKRKLSVRGRGLHSGDPLSVSFVVGDVNHWLETELASRLSGPIRQFINDLPLKISQKALSRGLYISGSGAHLGGLDRWLRQNLKCYCRIIAQPDLALIEGARLIIIGRQDKWLQRAL